LFSNFLDIPGGAGKNAVLVTRVVVAPMLL
jgi:hypothetical protein